MPSRNQNNSSSNAFPARSADEITFGIEIECIAPRGCQIPVGSYHHGAQVPGLPEGWTGKHDGSIHPDRDGFYGVEIVSPVLKGKDGLRQVLQVVEFLKARGARVNRSCGLHIHVGVNPDNVKANERIIAAVANLEEGIFATTGTPNRENGRWCKPIRRAFEGASLQRPTGAMADRYHALNLTNLLSRRRPTVEFRCFAGSLNGEKIVSYVRMVVGIVERAEAHTRKMAWSPAAKSDKSPYRRNGQGATEVTRLLYTLGWTKGRETRVWGAIGIDEADLPTLEACKKALRRLAQKYDNLKSGRQGESGSTP